MDRKKTAIFALFGLIAYTLSMLFLVSQIGDGAFLSPGNPVAAPVVHWGLLLISAILLIGVFAMREKT